MLPHLSLMHLRHDVVPAKFPANPTQCDGNNDVATSQAPAAIDLGITKFIILL